MAPASTTSTRPVTTTGWPPPSGRSPSYGSGAPASWSVASRWAAPTLSSWHAGTATCLASWSWPRPSSPSRPSSRWYGNPNRPKAITAPWASVGALTNDVASGGITYMEMQLAALERGLDLIRRVREELAEVICPVLLVYGDHDAIVDKANGPCVLERLGSGDKRLLALDYGKERIMVEVYDFVRRLASARAPSSVT